MPARTLASAAIASSLLAADVVVLTLYLNPALELRREAAALFLSLFLPYAIAGALVLAALALVSAALLPDSRGPSLGLPGFGALALLAVSAAAWLFTANLLHYRHSVPVEFVRALTASSVALAVAALILLGAVLDALLFPLRGRALSAPLLVLAAGGAVVVPLALRPGAATDAQPVSVSTERIQPTRRVVLLGIDGLDMDQLDAGVARGTLPVFAGLRRRGAYGPLATLTPTEGPPIWTSVFTGRLPRDHGVKSFVSYRLRLSATPYELLPRGALVGLLERSGLVSTTPVTAASRRRRALWEALNAFGVSTGVVRFWGTHPPERVQGFMLSNHFHRLREDARLTETLHPPEMMAEVASRAVGPGDVDRTLVGQFLDLGSQASPDDARWRRDLVERALAPDLTYQRAGAVLRAAYDPPFFANYFYGLDVLGHTFTRFSEPERFGDVTPEEIRRYGRVQERYTALLAQWIADAEEALRPGEVLLLVSGYGMRPVPWWRRLLAASLGETPMSGTHDAAPEGVLIAVGDGIRPGAQLRSASILDVAPTILYLMGLPVARDMEGRVLTEILEDDFARAHRVTLIPSYEHLAVRPMTGPAELDLPPLPEETP
jgi:predicted AlkP superfamily phosphohydrolase/phosphomutase